MGWKIGTIGLGVTTLGFATLFSLMTMWAFELQGKLNTEKAKKEGLETIIDIQGSMLSEKN